MLRNVSIACYRVDWASTNFNSVGSSKDSFGVGGEGQAAAAAAAPPSNLLMCYEGINQSSAPALKRNS